jgi:hypothetical protein
LPCNTLHCDWSRLVILAALYMTYLTAVQDNVTSPCARSLSRRLSGLPA